MAEQKKQKKNLIISFKNLPEEIKELFFEKYPDKSYLNYMQSMTTPKGEMLHLVNLETEDTSYMIKMDVKIDTFDVDDIAGADDAENDEPTDTDSINDYINSEDGDNQSHNVGELNFGAEDEDETIRDAAIKDIDEDYPDENEDYENSEKYNEDYDIDEEPSDEDLTEIDIDALLNDDIREGIDTGKKPSTRKKATTSAKKSTTKTTKSTKSTTKSATKASATKNKTATTKKTTKK